MKLNKKVWESPVVGVQVFVPQEFIAGCDTISGFVDYKQTRRSFLWFSWEEYGYYDNGEDFTSGVCYTADNGVHNNITVYRRYSSRDYSYSQSLGTIETVVIKNGIAYNNFS
ncbi:MAG: hypothetical protein IJM43_09045 [Bacteroidaceae bacterium]|nr:hypothetical protein [Bacteroidaceae bacterium]